MLCAHVYVPPIRADTRYKCMNPDVEFTVSKIVFYEILIMLRIKLKKKKNCLQGSDTNLEFNT